MPPRIASNELLPKIPLGLPWIREHRGPLGDRAFGGGVCYGMDVHKEWLGLPLWFIFGIIGAWIATSKGRGGCFWFLLCSFLGPIGLVIAAVSPRVGQR